MIMNIDNIIYLVRIMDTDSRNELPKPQEQVYLKLMKPKLALVVDNTKQKKPKRLSYDSYLQRNLGSFFEFLFEKSNIE